MKNRQPQFLRIPFTYKGRSSGFHLDVRLAEALKGQLGGELAAWVQRQADAILAERSGISWLELHRRLRLAITRSSQRACADPGQFRGAYPHLPSCILKTALAVNGPEQSCVLGG